MAADILLSQHAGLSSRALAHGAHQHTLLQQSLLMAQHPGAQQLMLARRGDPSPLLSSQAELGHHGLVSAASGLAVIPGLTAHQAMSGLHDYQHGLMGHQQQQAVVRGDLQQQGLGQAELGAANTGLQMQGSQHGGWPGDQHNQHQDPAEKALKYVHL